MFLMLALDERLYSPKIWIKSRFYQRYNLKTHPLTIYHGKDKDVDLMFCPGCMLCNTSYEMRDTSYVLCLKLPVTNAIKIT